VISEKGVATDPSKISAMLEWPQPKTLQALRGSIGLTGYYRKFVKNYGVISKPLTDLLQKNSFKWSETATQAFEALKRAMCSSPVLALPNFQQPFILETDACETGMGAVLMQNKQPIAYYSKAMGVKYQALSTYEKELMALVSAVQKWRHYLQNGRFVIRTDHESFKHLLSQKLTHSLQQKSLCQG
jgi:hypothetical protein